MWNNQSVTRLDAQRSLPALALMAALALPVLAHAGQGPIYQQTEGHDRRGGDHRDDRRDDHREVRHDDRGYVLDNRYNHNHYYPPRGYAVGALPRGYVTINYRGGPYYYHEGIWYRPGGGRYLVVRPAVGLYVPFLPPFYTTLWFGGSPYYYADDVYYTWRPDRRQYVVTDPPADAANPGTPPPGASNPASDIFVYPKNGQSEEQQAKDRYECHSWAASQTGFDPTQPSGGVAESQAQPKRDDYQRAMGACLEARGYSVK